MSTATLVADWRAASTHVAPALVTDILWAAARPGDGLEHVHALTMPGRMELTFFHCAPSLEKALGSAGRLCRRALDSSPALSHWRIAGDTPATDFASTPHQPSK
ncbi:hypothetical protein [Kitasatospora sp. NBC_01539]|uniref:hypothetical protein n=1 Tax=Kitasatospora sp. NBC_01539 TaxID=2903577 RepID=UPI003860201E